MTEIKDLNLRVSFYQMRPEEGPYPSEELVPGPTLYECWASVENVWMRDLELAKANGTLEDITVTIRDPRSEFIPKNIHHLSINEGVYFGKKFSIKGVRPDPKNKQFVTVIAGLVS